MKKFNKITLSILLVYFLGSWNISQAQVYINEFLSSNTSFGYDTLSNNYIDWIEIYNSESTSFDIGGYYLTDNFDDTTKWQIPLNTFIEPQSFLLFWADGTNIGLHTNFKLSSDGEEIGLYSPTKVLIDSIIYFPQQPNISFGRKPDGSDDWMYFENPTPGSSNSTYGFINYEKTEPPLFSINGGFYNENQQVELFCNVATSIIRYTTNGNEPDAFSPVYTTPIQIDSTSVIRARAYDEDLLASNTVTQTYFINVEKDLPVFSLVCDSMYLWDSVMGIYKNSALEQERFANVEYFENNKPILNQKIGIRIHGFVGRYLPQKTFGLYAKSKYGQTTFNHKFFNEKEIYSFKSIFLRNGGYPENRSTMFRDGLLHNIIASDIDIEYQAYKPAVLYLNGKYWGLYNIREKQNGEYLANNHNVDPGKVDLLENYWKEIIEGDRIHYNHFMDFITNNNINNSTYYNYIQDLIDVDNFINYIISDIYIANTDWPGANMRYWRPKEENGKWRWILIDLDFGFGMIANSDNNTLDFALAEEGTTWANPPEATFLLRKMMENNEFRNEFIQRFAAHMNITFNPLQVFTKIDSFRNNIVNEMPFQIQRWKNESWITPWGESYHVISSMQAWEQQIIEMKTFANVRASYVRQHIIDYFDLSGTINLTSNSTGGYIHINTVKTAQGTQEGTYFKNIPIKLKAVPDIGKKFSHWIYNNITDYTPSITIIPNSDTEITAVFTQSSQSLIPKLIDSDLTLFQSESPYYGIGDIIIPPNVTLTVEQGVEIKMPDSCCIMVFGELVVNGTEAKPSFIKANEEINATRWGAICIENATGTISLNNFNIEDASVGRNKLRYKAGITSYNSNVFLNGVSIKDADFPFYSEYGIISILNSSFRSDKTCDMINIKHAYSARVEGCTIKGNEYPDTDGIDYDNISNGIIRNNKIFGFFGLNSDGIDIGEGASDILIENNRIFNCSDKGISVGQASSAIIKRNLTYNCNMGVGVKDSLSFAYIDQNTFYKNNYGIACFEKNWGAGGGEAEVVNSILSECISTPVFCDTLSMLTINYSLSDTEQLLGSGNINDNPKFRDPLVMNFELKNSSPCIDAGDPDSPQDPDGSNADMGAYFTYFQPSKIDVVINEINYNSHPDFNSGDWIEVYNNSDASVDMSGWIFKDQSDDNIYHFPEGFMLDHNSYIVICNDIDSFSTQYPTIWNYRGIFEFGLKNSEETLRLFDAKMNLVDHVKYTNDDPWPEEPDGEGSTLQLIHPGLDNAEAENWEASPEMYGTPGSSNFHTFIHDSETEKSILLYPNPSNGKLHISLSNMPNNEIAIEVKNILGQTVYSSKINNNLGYSIKTINLKDSSKGIYILMVSDGKDIKTAKFILN